MIRWDASRTVHVSVSFLVAPMAGMERGAGMKLQTSLAANGVDVKRAEFTEQGLRIETEDGTELRIVPSAPQLSQVLVRGVGDLEAFLKQCEQVLRSFQENLPVPSPQLVVSRDCTVRKLYPTSDNDHAFKHLWVDRLRQEEAELVPLGRPVLGGGLRLVMPPYQESQTQVELKLESYLMDPRSYYLEVQTSWRQPVPLASGLDAAAMLREVDRFLETNVRPFVQATRD